MQQVKLLDSNEKEIFIKEIIETSIRNMLSLIKDYNKKGIDLSVEIIKINSCLNELIIAKGNFTLYEAKAKKIYYSCFNKIIKNKDFTFEKRDVYPPKDKINALMSYGYALLYSIIENDIHQSNLCISLPFIHGVSRHSGGLQYDIADIFKPVIVDRLIFRLINKHQINSEYFQETNKGVLLNKNGIKVFIEEFESLLQKVIIHNGKKLSYRSIIKREIFKIEKAIKDNKKYCGFLMRW